MTNVAQILQRIQQQQTPLLNLTAGVVISDSQGTAGSYHTERIFSKMKSGYTIQKIQTLYDGQIVIQYQRSKKNITHHRIAILNERGQRIMKWKPFLLSGETRSCIRDVVSFPNGKIAIKMYCRRNGIDCYWIGILNYKEALIHQWNCPGKDTVRQMFPIVDDRLVIQSSGWLALLDSQGKLVKNWNAPFPIESMIPFNGGVVVQGIKNGTECSIFFLDNQLNVLRTTALKLPVSDNSRLVAWDVTESGKCLLLVQTQHKTANDIYKDNNTQSYNVYCEGNNEIFSKFLIEEGGTKGETPANHGSWAGFAMMEEAKKKGGSKDGVPGPYLRIRTAVTFPQFKSLANGYIATVCARDYNQDDFMGAFNKTQYSVILRILRTDDGTVVLKSVLSGKGIVPSFAPGPQGECFILDGKDIKICDLKQNKIKKTFRGHMQLVTAVVLLSEGYFASTSAGENVTKIWDIEKGLCLQSLPGVSGKLMAGSEGRLIVNSEDGHLTICDSPIPKRAARGREFQPIWDTLSGNQIITVCNFQGLPLQDDGAIGIAQMLRMNQTITSLNLMHTAMTDMGAKQLLEALKVHGKVTTLILEGNAISPSLDARIQHRLTKQQRKPVTAPIPAAAPVTFDIPHELHCPITWPVMVDPVIAADGHTYESENIKKHFKTSQKSPLDGSLLPNKELLPNKAMKAQISSLHDKYPTLIHSGDVYFPDHLKGKVLAAANAGNGGLVAQLVAQDPRLLHEPLQIVPPLSLFVFALNTGPDSLLKKVVNLLGPNGMRKYVVPAGDEGISFFRQACQWGHEGAESIGDALGWNKADYEDELFVAIREGDLSRADVCLGLGVSLDVTDEKGDTLLHAAVEAGNIGLIEKLLNVGVSTKAVNAKGLTPQGLAKANGRTDLALFIQTQKTAIKMAPLLEPLMMLVQKQQEEIARLRGTLKLVGERLEEPYGVYRDAIVNYPEKAVATVKLSQMSDKVKEL